MTSFPMIWQQQVRDIAHFVKDSLMTSFPMTNSKWVIFMHILWKAVSSHFFLWPTGSEWHCTFVKGSPITFLFMTNSLWVSLHILWKTVSSHLSLWPIEGEWLCTFCEGQSHHIFSYDQQLVSDIAHSVKGSLTGITSFHLTNSLWVVSQIFLLTFSAYLNSWMFGISFHPIKTYQNVSMLPYLFHFFLKFYNHSSHLYHFPWFPGECWCFMGYSLAYTYVTRMNFSPCLGSLSKVTLRSRYFILSFWVAHNWCHCNGKPTDCCILVCELLLFIYFIYSQTFKQLLSFSSYPFGLISHFCHQSRRP